MKKLLGVMATIALLTSPVAIAQPGHEKSHQQGQSHRQQSEYRHGPQRAVQQQHVRQRQVWQRQVRQRQAANRAYNAATYRTRDYGYADPAQYRNHRIHRGWAQNRGNTWRWSEGERMGYYDRYYAPRVSYRRYNLRRPPYGYEWRRYDDRYVLVAITTGLILSVILDANR